MWSWIWKAMPIWYKINDHTSEVGQQASLAVEFRFDGEGDVEFVIWRLYDDGLFNLAAFIHQQTTALSHAQEVLTSSLAVKYTYDFNHIFEVVSTRVLIQHVKPAWTGNSLRTLVHIATCKTVWKCRVWTQQFFL